MNRSHFADVIDVENILYITAELYPNQHDQRVSVKINDDILANEERKTISDLKKRSGVWTMKSISLASMKQDYSRDGVIDINLIKETNCSIKISCLATKLRFAHFAEMKGSVFDYAQCTT